MTDYNAQADISNIQIQRDNITTYNVKFIFSNYEHSIPTGVSLELQGSNVKFVALPKNNSTEDVLISKIVEEETKATPTFPIPINFTVLSSRAQLRELASAARFIFEVGNDRLIITAKSKKVLEESAPNAFRYTSLSTYISNRIHGSYTFENRFSTDLNFTASFDDTLTRLWLTDITEINVSPSTQLPTQMQNGNNAITIAGSRQSGITRITMIINNGLNASGSTTTVRLTTQEETPEQPAAPVPDTTAVNTIITHITDGGRPNRFRYALHYVFTPGNNRPSSITSITVQIAKINQSFSAGLQLADNTNNQLVRFETLDRTVAYKARIRMRRTGQSDVISPTFFFQPNDKGIVAIENFRTFQQIKELSISFIDIRDRFVALHIVGDILLDGDLDSIIAKPVGTTGTGVQVQSTTLKESVDLGITGLLPSTQYEYIITGQIGDREYEIDTITFKTTPTPPSNPTSEAAMKIGRERTIRQTFLHNDAEKILSLSDNEQADITCTILGKMVEPQNHLVIGEHNRNKRRASAFNTMPSQVLDRPDVDDIDALLDTIALRVVDIGEGYNDSDT